MTEIRRFDGQAILYDPRFLPQITPRIFDLQWLRHNGHLTGSAPGRGQAQFLRVMGHDLVLRPYRRGGMMGRINTQFYLRLGAGRSRAFREFRLLDWMQARGLSVPRPVAARYATLGPLYRADLITERIAGARPLADLLHDATLPGAIWGRIGHCIGQMHALGVDHTDLNCRNILLDAQQKVWLIDFDKCRRRKNGAWKDANLARFRRSLDKETSLHPQLHWSDADWSGLMYGYRTE